MLSAEEVGVIPLASSVSTELLPSNLGSVEVEVLLSADEIEGILGAEAEIKIRPLQALLKALGLGISFYPEEPGSGS